MSPYHFALLLLPALFLSSCSSETNDTIEQVVAETEYKTLEWKELIPEENFEILLDPPAYIWEIEDGSEEDQLNSNIQSSPVNDEQDLYQQALVSTEVIEELDQQKVRLPGFIVPLEFNENSVVTTFFLVPYFGACTHEPAPPPNQIIYSEYEPGKKIENIYDPVWITGVIYTSIESNDMATSAYTMIVDSVSPYEYN